MLKKREMSQVTSPVGEGRLMEIFHERVREIESWISCSADKQRTISRYEKNTIRFDSAASQPELSQKCSSTRSPFPALLAPAWTRANSAHSPFSPLSFFPTRTRRKTSAVEMPVAKPRAWKRPRVTRQLQGCVPCIFRGGWVCLATS